MTVLNSKTIYIPSFFCNYTSIHKGYWKIENIDRQYFPTVLNSVLYLETFIHSISDHMLQFVILEDFITLL